MEIHHHKTDGGAEYLSFKPEGPEFISGVFARVDGGEVEQYKEIIPVSEVWNVIHEIENACKRDSMDNMSAHQLRELLGKVYDMLNEIRRK